MSGIARLAVMLSGTGRTMVNLAERIEAGELPAEIGLVIASRECVGAGLARGLGVRTEVIGGVIPAGELEQLLREERIAWVVLAGYLKRVDVPASYAGRVVNIHPSLLPNHGGLGMYGQRVHEAVLEAGDRESGCTVHLVDGEYDEGPIVLQRRCAVLEGDSADTLAARVFEQECLAYPEALGQLFARSGVEPPEEQAP